MAADMPARVQGNGRGSAHAAASAIGPGLAAAVAETGQFPPALRVVHDGNTIDLAAAQRAAADFLRALGMDTRTESLRDTPRRMASAYAELLRPSPFNLTTFPNDEGYDKLVLARADRKSTRLNSSHSSISYAVFCLKKKT